MLNSDIIMPGYDPYELHTRTLLLVEDDLVQRSILELMLTPFFNSIYLSANGIDALSIFKQHSSEIGVLITDMLMPMMDGDKLATSILAIKSVPVMLVTSLDADEVPDSMFMITPYYLHKPYKRQSLIDSVKLMLYTEFHVGSRRHYEYRED